MSDPTPPRVHVTLPGGRAVPGRLLRWRQDRAGAWWAEVALPVPAAYVQQTAGEDYAQVPREAAVPAEPRYALGPLPPGVGERRQALHIVGCWLIQGRTTPATQEDARALLRHGGATACDACQPEP